MRNSDAPAPASGPLLETKFYLPRLREDLVPRPRMVARLNGSGAAKLTLISAPPGFGKTTLLAEWLTAAPSGGQRVAWVSLDPSDNDPATFWTYVITALQRVQPAVGASVVALLRSPHPPPIETLLANLLNELGAIPQDLALALDDYHVILTGAIHAGMAYLLDHLPPQLHLIVASRADPPLPLARLRGRGELIEVRAADLRFTAAEAATFLNEAMGLELTAQQVTALEERTEGWIAALQLAALSMRGRDDAAGFISAFTGDDRYIVDYLVEEVLQRQPERVRIFLLETSVLDRLCGPLCDTVTGQAGGRAVIEALDRGNLFVIPLDDRRHWYRYHHLFADMLRARLVDERPQLVAALHQRASAWYEGSGDRSAAIRHALAAEDFARAADLVELAAPALFQSRQEAALLAWLEAIADEVIAVRPVLSVFYAGALLLNGKLAGVDAHLRDAEQWLDTIDSPARPDGAAAGMVVAAEEQLRRLPGFIALYRAGYALMLGQVTETISYARRALALLPEDDQLGRGSAAGLLGLAAWTSGDLEEGRRMYTACVASIERAGHIADIFGCAVALADIRIAQGRPREALRTYEQALQRATDLGGPAVRGEPDMHVGMSELYRERNDLDAALQCLQRSQNLGEHAGLPQNPYRWCVAMARLRQAQGDLDGALALLDEAERRYVSDFFPNVRPVAALRARVWVAQRRPADALGWARAQGLSATDDLSYLREYEHITLARALLAQATGDHAHASFGEAVALLGRLLHEAETGERTGSVIELLLLLAIAHHAQSDTPAALAALTRALALAEPEGYVRIFMDEGAPMAILLELATKRGIAPHYARHLLVAFGRTADRPSPTQALSEHLSERELAVLRLLATDLSGPDIARELVVSLNTVRTHTKNIYSKLGVNSRRAAIRRAEELQLLSRSRTRGSGA